MRDRPILFSSAMVRALLADTKTQTRRAMRVQPSDETTVHVEHFNQTVVDRYGDEQPGPEVFGAWWHDGEDGLRCPYGQPGDRLWVRETYFAFGRWETRFSEKKGRDEWHFVDMTLETGHSYSYAADGCEPALLGRRRSAGVTPAWWKRPAIFMPRDACRLVLEVTAVRVERLQAISEVDAKAEGITEFIGGWWCEEAAFEKPQQAGDTPQDGYRLLWEQINGAGSWDANPWVWVVEFKRKENPNA